MKIFLAGATGALGKRLVPLLVAAGHYVIATTRTQDKTEALRAAGAHPVIVDAKVETHEGEYLRSSATEYLRIELKTTAGPPEWPRRIS
jgi:nucleoside-diphosphate-sugar epimerase